MSRVAVVLDASALRAYADGVIAVGELMSEVADEGRYVGIPSACLVAARASVDEDDTFAAGQIAFLLTVDAVAVLPLDASDVLEVAEYTRAAGGDISMGHAVCAALAHEAFYVTARPKQAMGVLPAGWDVLNISE